MGIFNKNRFNLLERGITFGAFKQVGGEPRKLFKKFFPVERDYQEMEKGGETGEKGTLLHRSIKK